MTLSTDLAERIEIEAYTDFALGARDVLGVATRRFDQALAMATRHDSTGFWCKAGGFGPVTRAGLAEVCDFFRSQGVPTASIAIAPDRLPADWPDIRESLRLEDDGCYVKMVCEAGKVRTDPSPLDPALRVAPVERQDAEQWASVMMTTFEMTDKGMTDMAAAAIGRPNWHSYAVWEGDEIVAVGSTFRYEDATNLFGGATIPRARSRGAQTALLLTRANAACEEGTHWLTAETAADTPTHHNPSLHNLHRAGFRPLYERTNWLWRA
ncbi:MAG TPA: GNAT family N-acetyltransferase [Pseudonocardiaceae bacterium]|nr:GNAT family N-acetyltransferase [Pseudonocardiaceae bacterium]